MTNSKFEKVKDYYNCGLWTKSQVNDAVEKGWITREQYNEIIGEDNDNN